MHDQIYPIFISKQIVLLVGLQYVSVIFPGHTHLHLDSYNDTEAADLFTTKHALDNDLA